MKIKEFTISMGLFDKDTKRQEISTLDAYKICINYLMSITDGATITEGKGIYKHDDGEIVIEPTFVIQLSFIEKPVVLEIIKQLKVLFNQEKIVLAETLKDSDLIQRSFLFAFLFDKFYLLGVYENQTFKFNL